MKDNEDFVIIRETVKCAKCGKEFTYNRDIRYKERTVCDACKKDSLRMAFKRFKYRQATADKHKVGDTVETVCTRCKQPFTYVKKSGPDRTICDSCKEGTRHAAVKKKSVKTSHLGEEITATCEICGKEFKYIKAPGSFKRYCPTCHSGKKKDIEKATNREAYITHKVKSHAAHLFNPDKKSLAQICAEAKAMNMDYGTYKAYLYAQKMKQQS